MDTPDLWTRISTEPVLGVLAVTIGVLGLFVAVSFVWLVARSAWDAHLNRARTAFWHGLGRELVHAIGDPAREADWLLRARAHSDDVLRFCLGEYMTRTSGDYREGLARLYRELGLLAADLRDLDARSWRVRMRALRRLAGVVTSVHRDRIAEMADQGGEIRLLVAQIIGRIGRAEDVLALLRDWKVTSRLTEYPVHVMVGALSIEELRRLVAVWDQFTSTDLQRIILSAAARRAPSSCWTILPDAARHGSKEVRIAACHAAGHMTSEITLDILVTLAADAAWEVRAQAVKGLTGHHGAVADDLLERALGDPNFWVRQNAAAALVQHGDSGIARLRAVVARNVDRYARDAAEHVLNDFDLGDAAPPEPAPLLATAEVA